MTEVEFEAPEAVREGDVEIPSSLPILPLKETVVFPDSAAPLAIGQERSITLIDDVVERDGMLALITAKDAEVEQPEWDDLHEIGTAAIVHKLIKVPDGTLRILVQGLQRIKLESRVQDDPYLIGSFSELPDVESDSKEAEALIRNVQMLFGRIVGLVPYLPAELELAAANVDDPSALSHLVASTLRLKTEEKQQLLEQPDVEQRLRELSLILSRELEVFELGTKIQSQVQSELEKGQREYFLRQQLKAIQDELGEGDPEQAELQELRERVEQAELPEGTWKAVERELGRLERLPSASAEYGVIRTYLDWILSLPWSKTTPDNLDLERARQILDEDHYDLEKVKDRIIESLAVAKLKNDVSGSILCFVGPPGVGKTSLGQSIARTLEREFVRISVGGVRDESEIRGHRRTYIGAMPGTIIRALRDAESNNPVFLIDEIDKMGADFRGDPASAMLEVLDPEQHSTYRDHYLDLPFDLSKVLFIATANQLETIPPPLLDRMDVIHLSGYTEDEKVGIARKYLVPKQLEAHGLDPERVTITESALRTVIREYTREAGVRNLERELANLIRKAIKEILMDDKKGIRVSRRNLARFAGVRKFRYGEAEHEDLIGVSTGLAWTEVGGELLSIEAVTLAGKGRMTITGKLGDVMQESIQAAKSFVRSRSTEIGIIPPTFEKIDIHIHVPEGATPKDGPSAGVAMVTSIVSVLTKIPVKASLAMTGEITLRGRVLPIGGLKEKLLAALRGGIKTVLIPKDNEKDLAEIPDNVKKGLTILAVATVDEVLRRALVRQPQPIEWAEVETPQVPATSSETADEPTARLPN